MTERTLATVARALEARADQPGVFSGYASLFGVTDSQGDVVERGAFRASLEAWRTKGRRPAMLWQHDPNEPIGLWTDLKEDAVGLRAEGRLLLSVQAGADAYERIKAGVCSGLSIGFQTIESRRDRKTGVRHLVRVTLWEISLVTFPANHEARVSTVKAEDDRLALALDRIVATRPILSFGRKALTPFEESTGQRQPRDDRGLWTRVAGPGVGSASLVDWNFIKKVEGGQRRDVHMPAGEKSGPTVATGFDIGQRNANDLVTLGLAPGLREKLRPYLGLTGEAAKAKVDERRVDLDQEEVDAVDRAVARDIYDKVRKDFDDATGKGSFDALPIEARTTIFSVAYNEGPNLKKNAKRFWGFVTRGDWRQAVHELRNWSTNPDYLPGLRNRRNREADYLERMPSLGAGR